MDNKNWLIIAVATTVCNVIILLRITALLDVRIPFIDGFLVLYTFAFPVFFVINVIALNKIWKTKNLAPLRIGSIIALILLGLFFILLINFAIGLSASKTPVF